MNLKLVKRSSIKVLKSDFLKIDCNNKPDKYNRYNKRYKVHVKKHKEDLGENM